jgi:dimeric dUTPase (all-alpha-NTP-PPase superfamily)
MEKQSNESCLSIFWGFEKLSKKILKKFAEKKIENEYLKKKIKKSPIKR